jgi:hypothetical protein
MPRSDPSRKRCAIYTRKSSEEATSPAMLIERFSTAGTPSDQTRKNARSCNPPCRRPQSLTSGTSQGCSRPHREGRDRGEREGRLHQCRSEKNSQGKPARGQHVPLSGLIQAHTPGESRAFAPLAMEGTGRSKDRLRRDADRHAPRRLRTEFAADSPVEGAVSSELVSGSPNSLLCRENTGNFHRLALGRLILSSKRRL